MSNIKDKVADAAHSVADAAKDVGQKVAHKAQQAADYVQEKTGLGSSAAAIQPHMDVIASCGCKMGKVDHLEGSSIKLTKNDSPDGMHHFVPTSWVSSVDSQVHLNRNAEETRAAW